MKYKISNVRLAGLRWKLDLEYWEGCYCSAKKVELEITKDKKPTLRDAISQFRTLYKQS